MAEVAETSIEAHESIEPRKSTMHAEILRHLKCYGQRGRTCDEIEFDLGLRHQTASARMRELFQRGLVKRLGKRETRSGRKAYVWIHKEYAP